MNSSGILCPTGVTHHFLSRTLALGHICWLLTWPRLLPRLNANQLFYTSSWESLVTIKNGFPSSVFGHSIIYKNISTSFLSMCSFKRSLRTRKSMRRTPAGLWLCGRSEGRHWKLSAHCWKPVPFALYLDPWVCLSPSSPLTSQQCALAVVTLQAKQFPK